MAKNNEGAILLVTLWILAILSLLAVGIGFRTAVQTRLVAYQIDSLKAREIAKAGIMLAMHELEKKGASAATQKKPDTLWECGFALDPGVTPESIFKKEIGDGYFVVSYMDEGQRIRYGVEDLLSKININTASGEILRRLSPGITEDIANNIRAWRGDKDMESIRFSMSADVWCKNALLDDIHELLLVKDFTRAMFSDEENGIERNITVDGDPASLRLNVNTAGQKALEVIGFGAYADRIVKYRAGPDGNIETVGDNNVFTAEGLSEQLKVALSDDGTFVASVLADIAQQKAELVCSSAYFRISSTGVLARKRGVVRKTLTCVVARDGSAGAAPLRILRWHEE
ncbi:MAG: hypothetical protein WCG78_05295 [Candidatus Omnitrophota bacterium]